MKKNKHYSVMIETELSKYLGFNISELFNDTDFLNIGKDNDAIIFGGCLRDIIAKRTEKIADIDIVTLAASTRILINNLRKKLFIEIPMSKDLLELYQGLHLIFTPYTFRKENVVVQLIRPINTLKKENAGAFEDCLNKRFRVLSDNRMHQSIPQLIHPTDSKERSVLMYNLVSEVDLSTSGLLWSIPLGLVEIIEGAFEDCLNKRFRVLSDNRMHQPDRIDKRIKDLENKGFVRYV